MKIRALRACVTGSGRLAKGEVAEVEFHAARELCRLRQAEPALEDEEPAERQTTETVLETPEDKPARRRKAKAAPADEDAE